MKGPNTNRLNAAYVRYLEEADYEIRKLNSQVLMAVELHGINKRIDDLIDVMERIEGLL